MPTRHACFVVLLVGGALTFLPACAAGTRAQSPPSNQGTAAPAKASSEAESKSRRDYAMPPQGNRPDADGAAAESELDRAAPAAPAPPPAARAGQPSTEPYKPAPGAADPHSASGARVRLTDARRELEIATSERDCARACRALESMERAAQQVCALARTPEERNECTSAGEQVDKARTKLQQACGGCSQKFR